MFKIQKLLQPFILSGVLCIGQYARDFQSCRSPCCPHCLASNRRPNLNCEVFQLIDRVGSKPSCVFNRTTSIGADYITLDAPEIG